MVFSFAVLLTVRVSDIEFDVAGRLYVSNKDIARPKVVQYHIRRSDGDGIPLRIHVGKTSPFKNEMNITLAQVTIKVDKPARKALILKSWETNITLFRGTLR